MSKNQNFKLSHQFMPLRFSKNKKFYSLNHIYQLKKKVSAKRNGNKKLWIFT